MHMLHYEARRGHASGSSDLEKGSSQLHLTFVTSKGRVKEGTNREELKKIYLGLIQSSPAPNVVKQMAKKNLLERDIFQKRDMMLQEMGR